MKKTLSLLAASVLGISMFLTGCSSSSGETETTLDKLVIAAMASDTSDDVSANPYENLEAYLEEQVGIEVEIYEITSYEAGIESMRTGKADMNLFSAFSFYLAQQRADIEALVSLDMGSTSDISNTVIITAADSDINTIEDLKGRTFSFVDPASTSGHIVPRYYLINELDITTEQLESEYFSQVSFAGGHDTSAIGVINGQYDAGACVKMLLNKLEEAGMVDSSQYRIIAETKLDENASTMAIRSEIPDSIKAKIKEALLAYDDSSFFESYMNAPTARFCEADIEGLAKIEDVAVALNLDAETLLQ